MKTLRRLIDAKPIVRILEAHNGLTGLIAEKTNVKKREEKLSLMESGKAVLLIQHQKVSQIRNL